MMPHNLFVGFDAGFFQRFRGYLLPAFDFDSGVGLGSFLTSKTDRLIVLLVPRLPDVLTQSFR